MIYDKREEFLVKLVSSYIRKDAKERDNLVGQLHPDVREPVIALAMKALDRIASK